MNERRRLRKIPPKAASSNYNCIPFDFTVMFVNQDKKTPTASSTSNVQQFYGGLNTETSSLGAAARDWGTSWLNRFSKLFCDTSDERSRSSSSIFYNSNTRRCFLYFLRPSSTLSLLLCFLYKQRQGQSSHKTARRRSRPRRLLPYCACTPYRACRYRRSNNTTRTSRWPTA
jgi:hypothetical protein